jgi:hypothetical protein
MTAGSVISVITRNVPPHSGQKVTVEADRNCDRTNARLIGASHDVAPESAASDQAALAELEGSTDSKGQACGCASCVSYPARVWRADLVGQRGSAWCRLNTGV